MASCDFYGKTNFEPVGNTDGYEYDIDLSYNEVWMEVYGEHYCPQVAFDWEDGSVFVKPNENKIIKYTESHFHILPAVDAEGDKLMLDGRDAPYEELDLDEKHTKIHYLDEDWKPGVEYRAEVYDLKTRKKKVYKMVEDHEENMDAWEIKKYCGQADAESAA